MERSIGWLQQELQSDDERRHALAHELGVPFVTLEREDIDVEALQMLPEPLCRAHHVVAYKVGEHTLEVAMLELADLEALEPLRAQIHKKIVPRLTTRESLRRALLLYQKILKEKYGNSLLQSSDPKKMLDTLLQHALQQQASEVHIETGERGVLVRYRQGKQLREAIALPPTASVLFATIRTAANVGSKTLPQEGRFKADLGHGVAVVVRVSSVPVHRGEKLVLRLLREDATSKGFTLEGLGLHGTAAQLLRNALDERAGLVLVSGTQGSGRTTLLYTLLDMLNTPELSLMSVEDTVAMRLPYVAQTASGSGGLSMAAAVRASLRQDPDVVMLDEIADRDTAELAVAAAARGILVLASATEAALPFISAPKVLVRTATVAKLCDKQTRATRALERRHLEPLERHADFAKVLAALKEEERVAQTTAWKDLTYPAVTGCSECEGGYLGKTGLFEVVASTGASLNLYEDALFKAAAGITGLNEVLNFLQSREGVE